MLKMLYRIRTYVETDCVALVGQYFKVITLKLAY